MADRLHNEVRPSKSMKILFVHTMSALAAAGGAEVTLRYLMQSLTNAGHECVLLAADSRAGTRRTQHDGFTLIEVGLRNLYWPFDDKTRSKAIRLAWHTLDSVNPLMRAVVERICRQEQPDVASIHNLPGWSVGVWDALYARNVPIVQVLHDQYLICANGTMFRDGHNCYRQCASCRVLRLLHPRKSRLLSAVVGVSRFILEHHRERGYFQGVKVQRIIHDARPASMFGTANVPPRSAVSTLRFGFIGSITPVKGVRYLIEAFSRSDLENAELWLAGDLHSDYARALCESVSDSRIRFLGRVAPADFFPEIDVLVLPSLWKDTFPGVAFESLIFGRPVVAVNHGGAPEIIKNGRNGLVFDPDDADALPRCLERLAADRSLLLRLSRQAGDDGAYFVDTTRWVEEYLSVYASAIEQQPAEVGSSV